MRSGMVTGLFLTFLVVGLSIAYRERGRGHLHKLTEKMVDVHQDAPVPRPGGQEAITLTRTRLAGGSMPEFTSVTMLPGRGMNLLQITAFLPSKGEVSLLASPTVEEAERLMSGTGADANGKASLEMGGAFEAPWAGGIWGPSSGGGHLTTTWRGHSIPLPETGNGTAGAVAMGGLILSRSSESAATAAMPDGGQSEVTYEAGDFGAHWPSSTSLNVSVLLTSRSIELTAVARNTGDTAEPIGIGWAPRFAALDGHRDELKMRIPAQMRAEVRDRQSGSPTGVLLPVERTPYDFTARGGVRLGNIDLNDCFVQLRPELMDSGPVAELNDPANNFGLRLMALTPTIKVMRAYAPANSEFVTIEPRYNYDDPFGREWGKDAETGMVVLQPGQSTQWKVRLEIVSLTGDQPPI